MTNAQRVILQMAPAWRGHPFIDETVAAAAIPVPLTAKTPAKTGASITQIEHRQANAASVVALVLIRPAADGRGTAVHFFATEHFRWCEELFALRRLATYAEFDWIAVLTLQGAGIACNSRAHFGGRRMTDTESTGGVLHRKYIATTPIDDETTATATEQMTGERKQ